MAKVEESGAKDRAAGLARDMATWYQVQLAGVSAGLTGIMAALVRYQPVYDDVSGLFSVVGPVLLEQASSNSIKLVQISPNGWVRDTFPKSLEPQDLDLFELDTDREAALETVRSRQLTLQGPTPFVQGGYGVIVRRPIFIHGVNDTSAFSMPAPLSPTCGAPCAYDPANNSVFWGFASVLIDLVALNDAPNSRPRMLDGLDYRYEVRALGLAAASMRQVAASSTLPGDDAMEATVMLPNNEWLVRVAPAGRWTSNYYGGLIAAVVVLAFALSLLLFAALVLWRRHQMLLAVLLPRKVIQDLHDAGGAALEVTRSRVVLNTDTTADVMLRVLTDVVCGEAPAISDVMLVRSAIARSADIYEPIVGITEQMQEAHMDRDVADNLAQQLCTAAAAGAAAAALPRNITWQRVAGPGGRLLPKRAAVPSSVASADNSFRYSALPLPCSSDVGGDSCGAEGPHAGAGTDDHNDKAAGFGRFGSSEGMHLSDVFAAVTSAAVGDASGLMPTFTGLPSAAPSASQVAIAVSPAASERLAAAGSLLEAAAAAAAPPPAAAAATAAGAPAAAASGAVHATAAGTAAAMAVAVIRPAELITLSTAGAGGLVTTATATTLLESTMSDAVIERDEASGTAVGGPSAQRPAQQAVVVGVSTGGEGAKPTALLTGPLSTPVHTPHTHTHNGSRQERAPGALAPATPSGFPTPDGGRGLVPPAAAGGGGGGGAVTGGSPGVVISDTPEADGDTVQPLPELTRGTSYRRQRTSQLTDEGLPAAATDSEGSGDDGAGSGRALGHTHASDGHSGGGVRHVPGPHLTATKGGSARKLRPQQSTGVRVSASARVRGLIHGPGTHPQQHHHHLQQQAGSTGSSGHAATRPKGQSGSDALASGTSQGAAAGAAVAGGDEPTAAAGRAASPFLTGGATASAIPAKQQHMTVGMPRRAILEEVERVLSGADAWQFDTWRLAEVSGGLPLSALGYFLMQRAGLVKTLRLSAKTLIRCLRVIEAGYVDNPYHSATHAADVLQTLHVIIHSAQLHVHYLDPLGLFAAYWAAIVHDYRHPGLTGDFLVATGHPLAIRYNDKAPLENHHAAASFAVLRRRGLELLQPLPAERRVAFRKQVIEMVLATDMKQHFALCSQFSTVHRLSAFSAERAKAAAPPVEPPAGAAGASPRARVFGRGGSLRVAELQEVQVVAAEPLVTVSGSKGSRMGGAPQPLDESERLLAMCVAIKVADLGHLGEALEVHQRWLAGLEEEFFRQGDQERELGMPISPLFDRAKQGVSKSQTGFYEFVALPLVYALSSAFPGAMPLMTCFTANYQHWLRVQQQQQQQQQQQ